ncbi:orotidine-5'-phosphate decarboxylase [Lysobacter korlensis]|uniref:Orotidine-5'-phosphate decarboxylase n=1 Tax=Lysobacter korlensis TaxID=553636 RepID=A0ABV6RZD7_9GAMM
MTPGFGARLQSVLDARGPVCAGIDPHRSLLSDWGLPDTAAGVREFGLRVVEAATGRIGVVKPQVSFFERHGSRGFAALEEVLAAARSAGLLVVADCKRGDIGSTLDAYAEAWLTEGGPLEADAMTAVAYQGVGSLDPAITRALTGGKGVFVLAATSNPEARDVQTARTIEGPRAGRSVAAGIVGEVRSRNTGEGLGSIGVVVGATIRLVDYGLTQEELVGMPVLAPGFGHQGAKFADLPARYGPAAASTLVNVSRSVLSAGPDGLAAALDATRKEVAECLA